jgi:hypothetical protein
MNRGHLHPLHPALVPDGVDVPASDSNRISTFPPLLRISIPEFIGINIVHKTEIHLHAKNHVIAPLTLLSSFLGTAREIDGRAGKTVGSATKTISEDAIGAVGIRRVIESGASGMEAQVPHLGEGGNVLLFTRVRRTVSITLGSNAF